MLLLRSTGDSPALALLRANRTGILISCIMLALAPFLYVALDVLLFRVFKRRLDTATVRQSILAFTLISSILLFLVGIVAWGGGLWRAELPQLWGRYNADIQQIEAGTLEHMTVLLDEKTTPASMPGAPSDELTVHRRIAAGPDSDWEWVTLRFPDAMEFEPEPDNFVVIGQTYDWNWENVQQYEVYFTSEFHLVETITPVL